VSPHWLWLTVLQRCRHRWKPSVCAWGSARGTEMSACAAPGAASQGCTTHCMMWKESDIFPTILAELYLWCVAAIKRWNDSLCFLTVFCRTKAHIWLQHQVCSHMTFHIFAWLHFCNVENRLLRPPKLFLFLIQLAAPSYDNTTEMPSRFTPQHSRLSHRAPLKCVVVCLSFFIKFEQLWSELFFLFLSLFELLSLQSLCRPSPMCAGKLHSLCFSSCVASSCSPLVHALFKQTLIFAALCDIPQGPAFLQE